MRARQATTAMRPALTAWLMLWARVVSTSGARTRGVSEGPIGWMPWSSSSRGWREPLPSEFGFERPVDATRRLDPDDRALVLARARAASSKSRANAPCPFLAAFPPVVHFTCAHGGERVKGRCGDFDVERKAAGRDAGAALVPRSGAGPQRRGNLHNPADSTPHRVNADIGEGGQAGGVGLTLVAVPQEQ